MRLIGLAVALSVMIGPATGASAQGTVPVERRVDTLEKQMRSVQRRVFKPGSAAALEADAPAPPPADTGAVADLTARVDALERSLRTLTGQVEENGNRLRTMEEEARRARDDADARLDRLEAGNAAPASALADATAPAVSPDPTNPVQPATVDPAPVSTDSAENGYLAGFRLWEAKRYDEAEGVLKDVAAKHPKHRRASWARNLLGRAYLDNGKPATAAEVFLSNYQDLPSGDRAADSLYYLGAALMKLNKPEQACKVYDELADAYGSTMRDFLKQNLPAARKQAKCG